MPRYETCGSNNSFSEFVTRDRLNGAHLVVTMPALQSPLIMRYNYSKDEYIPVPGFNEYDIFEGAAPPGGKEWDGMLIEWWDRLAAAAGFTYEVQSTTGGSRAEAASKFTACVIDSNKGVVDVCVGRTWETTERAQLSQYSTALTVDAIKLLVRSPSPNTNLLYKVTLVFSPFSPNLWLMILLFTLVVALTYHVILAKDVDENSDLLVCTSRPSMREIGLIVKRLGSSWHRSMIELLSGGIMYDVEKDESRYTGTNTITHKIISIGWGGFIVVVLAAYTANLAAFLSKKGAGYEFSNLQDCLDKGCKLCAANTYVSAGLIDQIQFSYPDLVPGDVKTFVSRTEVSEAIAKEDCDAGFISDFSFYTEPDSWIMREGNKCDVTIVGDTLLAIDIGFATSDKFVDSASYWTSVLKEQGVWVEIYNKWLPKYDCVDAMSTDEEEEALALGVDAFAGPFALVIVTCSFALIVHFTRRVKKSELVSTTLERTLERSKSFARSSTSGRENRPSSIGGLRQSTGVELPTKTPGTGLRLSSRKRTQEDEFLEMRKDVKELKFFLRKLLGEKLGPGAASSGDGGGRGGGGGGGDDAISAHGVRFLEEEKCDLTDDGNGEVTFKENPLRFEM